MLHHELTINAFATRITGYKKKNPAHSGPYKLLPKPQHNERIGKVARADAGSVFPPCFQLLSFFFLKCSFNSNSISITQNLLFPRSTQLPMCDQILAKHVPES